MSTFHPSHRRGDLHTRTSRRLVASVLSGCLLPLFFITPLHASDNVPYASDFPSEWIGHQVLLGSRRIPFLGEVATRLDTYYLARLEQVDGKLSLVQRACYSEYAPIAGVRVSFPATALPLLRVHIDQRGTAHTGTGKVGWSRFDVDHDGNEGMSIQVDASICGGELYVGTQSSVAMSFRQFSQEHLSGAVQLDHRFQVHGASSLCLRAFSRNRSESASGSFAFIPNSHGFTCSTLAASNWPVRAK